MDLSAALVTLKSSIASSNAAGKMPEKIYRMAEIKDQISSLGELSTRQGKQASGYSDIEQVYEATFDKKWVADRLRALELELDTLQDELESFNGEIRVDIPESVIQLAK